MRRAAVLMLVGLAGCMKPAGTGTAPTVPSPPTAIQTPPQQPAQKPPPTAPAPPPAPVENRPAYAPHEHYLIDDVAVQVTTAEAADDDDWMMILVVIEVRSDTKRVTYRSWRDPFGLGRGAKLTDNFGNTYGHKQLPALIELQLPQMMDRYLKGKGGFGPGGVSHGLPRGDMLIFEKAIPKAEHLDLELPGENVGVKGAFRFRLPKPADPPPKK